jgi:hypothetical protein
MFGLESAIPVFVIFSLERYFSRSPLNVYSRNALLGVIFVDEIGSGDLLHRLGRLVN